MRQLSLSQCFSYDSLSSFPGAMVILTPKRKGQHLPPVRKSEPFGSSSVCENHMWFIQLMRKEQREEIWFNKKTVKQGLVREDSASIILTGVGRSLHQWITPKWQRLTSAKVVTQRSDTKTELTQTKATLYKCSPLFAYALSHDDNKQKKNNITKPLPKTCFMK